MKEETLIKIHCKMVDDVLAYGGRIDKVYYCTDIDYNSINLKPNIGMANQAKLEFKNVCFENSLMIGDSSTDIEFGKRLNMKTIGVGKLYHQDCNSNNSLADLYCPNLIDVVNVLA